MLINNVFEAMMLTWPQFEPGTSQRKYYFFAWDITGWWVSDQMSLPILPIHFMKLLN